jgi:hypothetical protein
MDIEEQLTILYHALAKANNALYILKFSFTTLELNSELKTFTVLAVDSYYSLYANLSFIFDGSKGVISLGRLLKSSEGISEKDRLANMKNYSELANKHKTTISKLTVIRNNAVSHIGKNYKDFDLNQESMDVQVLIEDLFILFRSIKGIKLDLNAPLILNDVPKIRDDLGQTDLWNRFAQTLLR